MSTVKLQIPIAFEPLFIRGKYRNKVFYGGRGGAKSHNFARALLMMGFNEPLRIACAREIQKSIRDSVYQLLVDIIRSNEWEGFYTIQSDRIIGKNGTLFIFLGLKHNITGVKSLEGVDIVWVEEAENVSDNSWEILIPTIRKENSEIWVSFNPKNPTDPTFMRFVEHADDNTLLCKVSWRDNPFFPDVLNEERKKLLSSDPGAYNHIWEGEFDTRHTGYVYANYIMDAREEGRITKVPYEIGVPVFTAWDLGSSNSTAIWFAQIVGYQPRIIEFYENNNKGLEHYAEVVRSKKYEYIMHYLPHDAAHSRLGANGSISDQLKGMGIRNKVLAQSAVAHGIEQTRKLISKAWFDDVLCHDGLHALNSYKYEWDENRNMFKDNPLHDWSSDACLTGDALIETRSGIKKIKDVVEGDYALTPMGYFRVNSSGCVKISDELIEIEFNNGKTLKATPEHKFFTERGLVYADALRYDDVILSPRSKQWKKMLSYTKEENMCFREVITKHMNGEKGKQHGIDQKKEKNGILNMVKKLGKIGYITKRFVKFVEKSTRHRSQLDQNIATRIVRLRRYVAEENVYDLTINKHHCYYANGVLVSNSDSLRYLSYAVIDQSNKGNIREVETKSTQISTINKFRVKNKNTLRKF